MKAMTADTSILEAFAGKYNISLEQIEQISDSVREFFASVFFDWRDGVNQHSELVKSIAQDMNHDITTFAGLSAFTNQLAEMMQALLEQKQWLYTLINTDPLTGLANRRVYDNAMDDAIRLVAKGGQASAVFLDIDQFKGVNSAYTHHGGDVVLRTLAMRAQEAIYEIMQEVDTNAKVIPVLNFCRWAGDEFGLVIRNADPETAAIWADRILAHINHTPAHWNGEAISFSATHKILAIEPGMTADAINKSLSGKVLTAKADAKAATHEGACTRLACYLASGLRQIAQWVSPQQVGV